MDFDTAGISDGPPPDLPKLINLEVPRLLIQWNLFLRYTYPDNSIIYQGKLEYFICIYSNIYYIL
jgi:hypothetical protein